jgi:HTH-type transcriptional regulator / antitoxin HipB
MEQIARNSKQVGAAPRRQRNLQGLSQGTLGQRINLRQSTVSSLESGHNGTKLGTLIDVLSALDLELVIRARTKGSHANIEDIF